MNVDKSTGVFMKAATENWPRLVKKRVAEMQREKQRAPQMKLTVIVKDRFGGLVPQVIMIDGATPVHKIGQAIVEAVRVQTVNDGTGIVRATIGPDEIYNVS